MMLCPDCNDLVHFPKKSPRNCFVAVCGRHLVAWREFPPARCRAKLALPRLAKLVRRYREIHATWKAERMRVACENMALGRARLAALRLGNHRPETHRPRKRVIPTPGVWR
jgi:hypothetical protein